MLPNHQCDACLQSASLLHTPTFFALPPFTNTYSDPPQAELAKYPRESYFLTTKVPPCHLPIGCAATTTAGEPIYYTSFKMGF